MATVDGGGVCVASLVSTMMTVCSLVRLRIVSGCQSMARWASFSRLPTQAELRNWQRARLRLASGGCASCTTLQPCECDWEDRRRGGRADIPAPPRSRACQTCPLCPLAWLGPALHRSPISERPAFVRRPLVARRMLPSMFLRRNERSLCLSSDNPCALLHCLRRSKCSPAAAVPVAQQWLAINRFVSPLNLICSAVRFLAPDSVICRLHQLAMYGV